MYMTAIKEINRHIIYIIIRHCYFVAYVELLPRVRILVQVTIHRRLLIGRDDRLDQSKAYDIS